jgi:hypothetical protein
MPAGAAPAERGARDALREPRIEGALERLSLRVAHASDTVLAFLVLAMAAWTAIYHVCLVLDLGTLPAAVAVAVALVPAGWFAFRRSRAEPEAPERPQARPHSRNVVAVARVGHVLAAVAAAAVFAFADAAWGAVWILWLLAAAAAVAVTSLRPAGHVGGGEPEDAPPAGRGPTWPATLAALVWAVALATFSLFIVNPNGDDTLYVRLSSWIAAHGEFPERDVIFSDEALPAIIFPPLSSLEALLGTIARVADVAVPNVVYLVVTPLASALAVLAAWRLLRAWGLRMVGLALSVALLFLLLDAPGDQSFGNFFISRLWQGKVIFLAVLVPLLFVLLTEYVERPTGRRLVLLAASGAAAVGLSTTGVFVVPVIAAGCLAPLVLRSPRRAAAGVAAVCAYPVAAAAATVVVGPRNAAEYSEAAVVPGPLAHLVLGEGVLAFVAMIAVLVGPVLIRRASAAKTTAVTVLLVACLFAPRVPLLVYDLTGLGRVLWRLTWALPAAALVGVLAAGIGTRIRIPALRALPAALLCAALVAWGTPLWSEETGTTVAESPSWKLPDWTVTPARRILAHSEPGDVVLASPVLSRTILALSGTVTTVAPRDFYAGALRDVPGGHGRERLLLLSFFRQGLGPGETSPRRTVEASEVVRALRTVGVDLVCVSRAESDTQRVLFAAGYVPARDVPRSCWRALPTPG